MIALLLLACTGKEPADGAPTTTPPDPAGDTSATEAGPCDGSPVDAFDGWSRSSVDGVFTVEVVSAEPESPEDGLNTWTVRVLDGAGAPLPDAAVTLMPFMSVHGHGTSPPNYDGTTDADGVAVLGPFDLIMPGPWDFTFELTTEARTDSVVGTFCADG